MGLFNFIFGKPKIIQDEFFGTMRLIEFKNKPEKNYFECKRPFQPTGADIDLTVDGDMSGVTAGQVALFKRIEANYPEICRNMIPLITDEFRNADENFTIVDFEKEFTLIGLNIPRCETEPVEWEITFETIHDENHIVEITMQGFEAKEILIDG